MPDPKAVSKTRPSPWVQVNAHLNARFCYHDAADTTNKPPCPIILAHFSRQAATGTSVLATTLTATKQWNPVNDPLPGGGARQRLSELNLIATAANGGHGNGNGGFPTVGTVCIITIIIIIIIIIIINTITTIIIINQHYLQISCVKAMSEAFQ